MLKSKFHVSFMRYFTSGSLAGLTFDATLDFATLDEATDYMGFLLAHTSTPVNTIGGSPYTCHVIRMGTS